MNEIINYYIKSLSSASKSLKKKSILVEKPWALIDNDGEIQKLIFRKDKGLVLSKNGVVTEGSWEYYPDARSLFIDRGTDKLLLNEQYIDENVMILKIDGTGNEFYAMANENTIPDYDIPKYLHSINCKIFAMRSIPLLNSKTLQIPNSPEIDSKICLLDEEYMPQDLSDGVYITKDKSEKIYIENGKIKNHKKNLFFKLLKDKLLQTHPNESYEGQYLPKIGSMAHFLEDNSLLTKVPDGDYMTKNKKLTIIIKNSLIKDVKSNFVATSPEGISYEIECENNTSYFEPNKNLKISINGNPVDKDRFLARDDIIFKLENSIITEVLFLRDYILKGDYKIQVEHKKDPSFKKGDIIINSEPVYPLPDGKYRIQGKLRWIKVENGVIV